MRKKKWEKLFAVVAEQLREDNPEVHFDIFDDDDELFGQAIEVLSSGPDFAPDIQVQLPPGWLFMGWRNPDQRNNMGTVVMHDTVRENTP